ncbi:MAG: hypothetical protein ISR65_19445 [Bacteriovoracaceae bacterium]|nr:hypothetical protein [Bacteriovoracaceae bacterium]
MRSLVILILLSLVLNPALAKKKSKKKCEFFPITTEREASFYKFCSGKKGWYFKGLYTKNANKKRHVRSKDRPECKDVFKFCEMSKRMKKCSNYKTNCIPEVAETEKTTKW